MPSHSGEVVERKADSDAFRFREDIETNFGENNGGWK